MAAANRNKKERKKKRKKRNQIIYMNVHDKSKDRFFLSRDLFCVESRVYVIIKS
jgi:hypothetical protein